MEITGFQTIVALCAWGGLVLLHVFWRVLTSREVDPIRASGPVE